MPRRNWIQWLCKILGGKEGASRLGESGRHVTWFANQELDILSLSLRLGRC